MVTKLDIRDYYANNRKDSNRGLVPEFVESHLAPMYEDATGLFTQRGELFGQREYYTRDEVIHEIRCDLAQYIKDLTKLLEV